MRALLFSIVFVLNFENSYSQNLILNPGFELGWQASASYDGKPGLLSSTNNCNYTNADYFDNEVLYWKVANHNNGKDEKDPDWTTMTCANLHVATCGSFYSFHPSGNKAVISADIYSCKKKFGGVKIVLFHEAIRIGFDNSLINNQEYIIRYSLLPVKSIKEAFGTQYPLEYYCNQYTLTAHMRVFFSELGEHWDKSWSKKFEAINANVILDFSSPCKWNYIERSFTVPNSGTFRNLILYMESGAYVIDDVEIFEKCTDHLFIQNKIYASQSEIDIEAGSYFESVSNYINAGYSVGAANIYNGDVVIHNGANVEFSAGNFISLKPGFRTEPGARFIAKIEPCSSAKIHYNAILNDSIIALSNDLKRLSIDTLPSNANDDMFNELFNVYPNPASSTINIESYDKTINNFSVSINNIFGTKFKQVICYNHFITMDISDLPQGVYTLSIKYKDITSIEKLVIQ